MKKIILIGIAIYTLLTISVYAVLKPKPSLHPQKLKSDKHIETSNNIKSFNNVKKERRRINKTEKELIESHPENKIIFKGRSIMQRKVFQCSKDNIALMLKGRAPFGTDLKKVNLHHLKQQKVGTLVELTETEHTTYTKDLHRHVKIGSEIDDRDNGFKSFKQQYWKSRAVGCKARGR